MRTEATPAERGRLRSFVDALDQEAVKNRDWWFTEFGNQDVLYFQLHPEQAGDTHAARSYWARVLGPEDAARLEQLPYLRGFVEGALAASGKRD